jgi:hypothetical protein
MPADRKIAKPPASAIPAHFAAIYSARGRPLIAQADVICPKTVIVFGNKTATAITLPSIALASGAKGCGFDPVGRRFS